MEIYTSTVRYNGTDRLDVSVKSGDKVFAPSWEIVMGVKEGKITEAQYITEYTRMMLISMIQNRARWEEVAKMDHVTFCCYCPPGAFCHRKILAELFVKFFGAKYMGESQSSKKVAIIGTRNPTLLMIDLATLAARYAVQHGHSVSTGAADGIDSVAMTIAGKDTLVYLPWSGYNAGRIPQGAHVTVYDPKVHIDWYNSVKEYHPGANNLTQGAYSLHARNYGIVEGASLVVAFPSLKKGYGGTGQGIRVAKGLGIPCIITPDKKPETADHFIELLDKHLGG